MTSSSDTFPFGIADVVELLGLTVRRRLPSSLYLNCPFCGDQRGRLNVNTDKNVWRCNRCGAAGGMLALYAHYYCTSNADAYREICEALGRYTPRPRVNDCIGIKPEQNARATPQEIHQTYSLLLSMLPLTPTHKAHLLSPRRGLTEYQIARFGLKSTPPAFLCRGYAERLRRQGCTLQGVPGFYQDDAGRWTINFGSRTAGILLPAVGLDGLICGMQIRLDTPLRRRDDPPGKSGAKYIWLSSIGKPHGVTSGSPLHFVGEPFAKTVYVTEGLLKADIAHCLTGRSFIAVAGVNSLNGLESALRCMAQNGTKLVVEAYDMDKLENEYVASAAEKVQQIAHAAGLQSTSLVWNTAYKGIQNGSSFSQTFVSGFLMHCLMLASCYLQLLIRKHNQNQTTNYSWYTVPTILSTVSVLLIFFFGTCFEKDWISILPLCVCASFITCMQIAALLLVSWMEQTAHFREEALSLQTKSTAQRESIEALSAAYTQQRKLTHDFRAHLDTLSAMLAQQPFDIDAIKSYVRSLQSAQTSRILLVNTHHSALDALLNQKALVARNRSIDVQFRVNDLSAVKIDLVDLTVIISNTLDNAIEACEKLPVQDRQIYIQVVLDDNELFYAVRNRSLPVDVSSDRLPVTTKENPSFHGYGLQNVQTTLAKYHSVYAMDYADGWFEFATDLPNTLIS